MVMKNGGHQRRDDRFALVGIHGTAGAIFIQIPANECPYCVEILC